LTERLVKRKEAIVVARFSHLMKALDKFKHIPVDQWRLALPIIGDPVLRGLRGVHTG
jgi:hypothetical protein